MRINDGGSAAPAPVVVKPAVSTESSKKAVFTSAVAKAKTDGKSGSTHKAAHSAVESVKSGKSISQVAAESGLTYDQVIQELHDGGYETRTTSPATENGVATVEIRDPATGTVVTVYDHPNTGTHSVSVTDAGGKQTATPLRDGQGRKVTTSYDAKTGASTTRTEDDLGDGTVTETTTLANGTVVTKTTKRDSGPVTVVTAADGSKTTLAATQDPTSKGAGSVVDDMAAGKSIGQIAQERGLTYDQVIAQLRAAGLSVTTTTPATENGVATVEIRDPVTGKVVTEHDRPSSGNHYNSVTDASGRTTDTPTRDGQGRKVVTTYDAATGITTTTYVNDLGDGSTVKETELPSGVKVVTTTDKSGKGQTVVTGKDGRQTTLAADQNPSRQGTQTVIEDIAGGKTIDQIAADHGWTRDQVLAQLAAAGVEVKTATAPDNGALTSTQVIDQHSGKVIAGYYTDARHDLHTTEYTDASGSHVRRTTRGDGSSSETVTEANGRVTDKTTKDGKTTVTVTFNGYTLTTAPDGSKTLADTTTGTTLNIKAGTVDATLANLLMAADPHSSDPAKAKQGQIIISLVGSMFAGESLSDVTKAAGDADAALKKLLEGPSGKMTPAQPGADQAPGGKAPSGGNWMLMEMGGAWYWVDPVLAQAYVADQIAQTRLALVEGKATQGQTQLDVYALDPSYDGAMDAARGTINKALAPYQLEWNPTKPKGTLEQAKERLTVIDTFMGKAGAALGDYQSAAGLLDTAIAQNNALKPVSDPNAPAFTNPGTNRQLEYKQALAAHAQVQSLFAQIGVDMSNGDLASADAMIALSGTADAPDGTLAPGDKAVDITIGGKTIKVAPDVAAAYQKGDLGPLTGDKAKPVAIQVEVTNPDGTTTTQWRWMDPKLALQKIGADAQVEFSGAFNDYAQAQSRWTDVDARAETLKQQLVSDYNKKRGFQDPNKEFSTNGGKYLGKFQSQDVEYRKDGQIWVVTHFEHGQTEEQLTFDPNDRNVGDKYRTDPLNLQWQALWHGDPQQCGLGGYQALDAAALQADNTLKTVWGHQLDIQRTDLNNRLTGLGKQYDDVLDKAGFGKAAPPEGTLPDGVQPVDITVDGQTIKVAPDVARRYRTDGKSALTSGGKAIGVNVTYTDDTGVTHTEWRWFDPATALSLSSIQSQMGQLSSAISDIDSVNQWLQRARTQDDLLLSEPSLLGVTDPSVDKTLLDDHQQQALDGIYQGEFQNLLAQGYDNTFEHASGSALDSVITSTFGYDRSNEGGREAMKKIEDEVHGIGGDNPLVNPVPMFYVDDAGGSQQVALLAVQDSSGHTWYVDATGRKYKDLKEFQDNNNQFSEHGKLVVPTNLDMTAGADGRIALEVVNARNVSAMDRIVDPVVGAVTSVATVLSFIPVLTVFAAPVALLGGLYFGGRALYKEGRYLDTGGELGDGESLMNLATVATSVLPEVSGTMRTIGMARGLNLTKGEAFLAAFGAARASGSVNAIGEASGFGRIWYALPHAKQFGFYLGSAGGLNKAAYFVDATAMLIGLLQMGDSAYNLAAHGETMSGLNFLSALTNLGIGFTGTGLGMRNAYHYALGEHGTTIRLTGADGRRINAMVMDDGPASPDKVYIPSGNVRSLNMDDPALADFTHILLRDAETGQAVVVPFTRTTQRSATPVIFASSGASSSSSPYARLPDRSHPGSFSYSSGKEDGQFYHSGPGARGDIGPVRLPTSNPFAVTDFLLSLIGGTVSDITGQDLAGQGHQYRYSGPVPAADHVQGTGRADDAALLIWRNNQWYNKATGEPVEVSAATFRSPGDVVAGRTSDLFVPASEPQYLAGHPGAPINVRGTGRPGDESTHIFVGGQWYNKATGRPVDGDAADPLPAAILDGLGTGDEPSPAAVNFRGGQAGQSAAHTRSNPSNLTIRELDPGQVRNTPLDLDQIRAALPSYLRGGPATAGKKAGQASIAVASIREGDSQRYVLAISGLKSWRAATPQSINIHGTTYDVILPTEKTSVPVAWDRWTVMRTDAKASVNSLFGITTHPIDMANNYHPDSLVFEYLENTYGANEGNNYQARDAHVSIAIQNVSAEEPGMCFGCSANADRFAHNNPNLTLDIMEGTTGAGHAPILIDPGLDPAGRAAIQTALGETVAPGLRDRPFHLVVTNNATFDYAYGIASGRTGAPPLDRDTSAFINTDGSPGGVTLIFARRGTDGSIPDVVSLIRAGRVPVVSRDAANPPSGTVNELYAPGRAGTARTITSAAEEPGEPAFVVKMTDARRRALQTKFDVETESRLRAEFGDTAGPAQSHSKPIIRLDDAEFEALYQDKGGTWPAENVRGFRDPAAEQIYLRDQPARFLDPEARMAVGHEYLHDVGTPEFDGGPTDIILLTTGASIHEGATQYRSFKTFGPKQFTEKPYGYSQYIDSLRNEHGAVPDDIPYWREGIIAENVFEQMEAEGYDGYFRSDRGAIEAFQSKALLDGNVILVTREPDFLDGALPLQEMATGGRPFSQPPGDAYAASSWATFYRRLQKGQVVYPNDQYVYVVRSPRGSDAVFDAGSIVYQGRIRAGANDVDWIGTPPPDASARKVADIFGAPGQGSLFRVVVSSIDPQAMQGTQGQIRVPVASQIPGQPVRGSALASPQRATTLSGSGYPAYSWTTLYGRLQKGQLTFPSDQHVYVIRANKGSKAGDIPFRASDIAFQGKIGAGANDVAWTGAAQPNVSAKKVADIFGDAGPGKIFRVVVTPESPATLAQNKGVMQVSYTTSLPGGPAVGKSQPQPQPTVITPPPSSVKAGVPIPASGDRVFPTRLWPRTEGAIRRGFFASADDQYVYVFAVGTDATGRPATLKAGGLQAYGILPAGADDIIWQPGFNATPEQIAKDGMILDSFGTPTRPGIPGVPRASQMLAFVVSKTPKTDLDTAGSITNIPWVLDEKGIPGPANAESYQQPRYGFKGRFKDHDRGPRAYGGVQSVLGVSDAYNRGRGRVYRPGEGWVEKGSGEPRDARRIPQYAVNVLRGPKYAYQDSTRGTVARDAHNHKGTFVHPFYINDRVSANRLLRAAGTPGIINDPDVQIQISNQFVPYAVMRGGKWTGYTDVDTARTTVKYAPMDDHKTLRQWSLLSDEEKARIIPSITGIPTYPVAGYDPGKYVSDLLTWHYDVYPMAGELTVRAKELWTILNGRTGTTRKPYLSTDVGDMVGRDEQTLLGVFEALRDAGILTSVHNDASFAEFAADGRPTPASGDSRFFFGLMRLLMMVGPYDMRNVITGPNFRLSDSEVAAILAAGPTRRPLNVIGAHFFMGNITKAAPHIFELLQMLLNHPLLQHVRLDSSWLPTAEHMLSDVRGFAELIATGRVLYGGDVLNFQSIQQLAAPWFLQQPVLARLDAMGNNALGHDALNWYAGDALREAYESSKPAMDWYRYRNYRAGTSQDRIDAMPPARRKGFDDFIARYERDHPEVLDPNQYSALVARDQIPGQQPLSQLWTPPSASLPRIQLRSSKLQDAVYRLAHGEDVDLNQITGRSENPLLPQPPAAASKGTPVTMPSRADIENFLLGDPVENVRDIKRPDGTSYSEAAYDAGESARETGANRGLQLLTMAMTDLVDRSQAPVNAELKREGNQSDRSIRNRFIATFSAMVAVSAGFSGTALASPEVRSFIETSPTLAGSLPWIVAGALFTRGTINVFGNASRQTTRKINEAHNEQGIAGPKWIEFLKSRILRYGPNSGFDMQRFEGDQGIKEAMDDVIASVAYLMESPLDVGAGETQALRHQFITTIESLLLGQVGAKLGAAQGSLDPTNFRTPSGKWISAATALAYELGVLGSIADLAVHPDHFYAYASGLGAFLYATNHALGAISGHYNANWTELPFFSRLMSIGTNSVLATGAGLYAAEAASEGHYGQAGFAGIASLALVMAARLGLRAEVPRTPAEMRKNPSDSIPKLRDLLERAVLPGDTGQPGVSKPRRLPMWLTVAGLSLIGLSIAMAIDEWEKQKGKGSQPGGTPGPSPTSTPTPSPSVTTTSSPGTSVPASSSPATSQPPSPTVTVTTSAPPARGRQPVP